MRGVQGFYFKKIQPETIDVFIEVFPDLLIE